MLGAYFCTLCNQAGINLWLSFILAALAVGLFGIIVERFIIQWLYGRIIDTLLATWGLSLLLVGGVTTIFGPQTESVAAPLGNVQVGAFGFPIYGLVMMAIAVALLGAVYAFWRFTRYGLIVRGTMQNPTISAALGVNRSLVYMLTFRLRLGAHRARRRGAGAHRRRLPHARHRLRRQGLHHGHHGRPPAADRHR